MLMNLQDAFEQGKMAGLTGKPDRIIETLISKLFFFGDDVYKVYKYNKVFFGDFSDPKFRHEFYHDDFTWNNTMAPSVYIKLGYAKKNDEGYEETHHEAAEDYYIVMKKFDDSQTLHNLIKKNDFKTEDLKLITEEMFKRTEKLTEIKRSDMQDLFNMSYVDLDLQNLETTREWLYMGSDIIPKEEANMLIDKMKEFVATHPFFKDFNNENFSASIDNHNGNILFIDGEVNFIDSMPPMRIWRIQSDAYSVSRPATDVEVLAGKKHADAMFAKYEEVRNVKLDSRVKAYLQAVAALIQAPYMYVLKEAEYAKKFWEFAKQKVKEMEAR